MNHNPTEPYISLELICSKFFFPLGSDLGVLSLLRKSLWSSVPGESILKCGMGLTSFLIRVTRQGLAELEKAEAKAACWSWCI
jgi:hypothetical protein